MDRRTFIFSSFAVALPLPAVASVWDAACRCGDPALPHFHTDPDCLVADGVHRGVEYFLNNPWDDVWVAKFYVGKNKYWSDLSRYPKDGLYSHPAWFRAALRRRARRSIDQVLDA